MHAECRVQADEKTALQVGQASVFGTSRGGGGQEFAGTESPARHRGAGRASRDAARTARKPSSAGSGRSGGGRGVPPITRGTRRRTQAGAVLLGCRSIVTTPAEEALDLFHRTGAYLRGHFRLTSGLHSPEYLQCALVLQYPSYAQHFGTELASLLREAAGEPVKLVAAPALGGLIIGHEVARALGVRFIFTERAENGKMTLRRGFEVTPGETAVVIEDVVTTGGSSAEVVKILECFGARVLAAGSIIDRSGGRADLGVKRVALATLQVVAYPPEDCPMCKQGVPVQKPGSRPT
ncbi:MAG: orotate phosphoribosyltransferase [Acidobacteria bacterium]|nr:orotate phosphoribosyltransferase [Acidobacteriota bacterium]